MALVSPKAIRIVSVVASTVISLACGTNYAYSAWAPQFAEKLGLSATESNLIGQAGNMGMYASGIPFGFLNDAKGHRPPLLIGAAFLGIGYLPLKYAYDRGPGALSLPILCIASALTGSGGCAAFLAAVKTSALNWPNHRGTATGFCLAAFGLSAFFFSFLAATAVRGSVSDYLLLLSLSTFLMIFISYFFIRVVPPAQYEPIPAQRSRRFSESTQLHRTKSKDSSRSVADADLPGRPQNIPDLQAEPHTVKKNTSPDVSEAVESPPEVDESSSLVSRSSSCPGDSFGEDSVVDKKLSRLIDIRGLSLLSRLEFWLLFFFLGCMAGIGLMNINNIGNNARALWKHYDGNIDPDYVHKRQVLHVSILSLSSFCGRLLSGIGSDVLVKKLGYSRLWCQTASAVTFMLAQLFALTIENPNLLWAVSSFNGLGYGILFGFYPAMVAETFGMRGLSVNWGIFTLSAVFGSNIFNIIYGRVYDAHSVILPGGARSCDEGNACYRGAYVVTFFASVAGLATNLLSFREERKRLNAIAKLRGLGRRDSDARVRGSMERID